MSSMLRSLARGVATHNMKEAGLHKPHEQIFHDGISWFGDNWREWVHRSQKSIKETRLKKAGLRRGGTK